MHSSCVRILIFSLLSASALASAQAQSGSETPEELARRAQEALNRRPEEAASLYRQLLASRPHWPEGWLYLGASLHRLGQYPEASDALRKGVALAPNNGVGWAFLGLCEAMLDNREQAVADIRKGLQLGIGGNQQFEIAARVTAARLLAEASEFDEAQGQLYPLSRRNISSPAIFDVMGLTALVEDRPMATLSPERRAVISLAGRAAWALVSQKPSDAEQNYRELLAKYSSEPGVHYAYGLYLMETDLTAALASFEKEIGVNPQNWPARIVIASLQVRQGAAEKATATLREAMPMIPPKYRWLLHAEIGRATMNSGNLDTAIRELQTAVWLKPGNAQLYFLLSQAYRMAGRAEEAKKASLEFQKWKAMQDPLGVPGLRTFSNASSPN